MLPSFRLIVATFFSAFILVAVGLQLVGTPRATQASRPAQPTLPPGHADMHAAVVGTVDWHRADAPVPAIFDLRFSADLSAIAAIPARLSAPADNPKLGAAPAPSPEIMPSATDLTLLPLAGIAALASPESAEITAPPETPPTLSPPDVVASLIVQEPDLEPVPVALPAAIQPPKAPEAPPKRPVKHARKAAAKKAVPAAPPSFLSAFGIGAQ